jgi:5-methylcytosine-specific restriction protein B
MSIADDVRDYCINNIVEQARLSNKEEIVIRVGDIHNAMGLKERYSSVCSAIGSEKFEEEAGIKRIEIHGPLNASNTIFVFSLIK